MTLAMKLALEYLENMVIHEMTPIQARQEVASLHQVPEEHVRRYHHRHFERIIDEIERKLVTRNTMTSTSRHFNLLSAILKRKLSDLDKYSAQLVDTEKAIAAMYEGRSWLADLFDRWRAELPEKLAAMESESEIRALLAKVIREGLLELSRRAHERAQELRNDPGSNTDPAIPHGGVIYLEAFAEGIKPRNDW